MTDKLKNILRYSVSAAVAVILLYACFRNVRWADFTSALESCRWGFVVLSMAVGVLSFWLRAIRWRMLLGPVDPSISRRVCFNSVNIGYLANLVLPRAGEFVRCGFITKASEKGPDGHRRASYDKVIGTVVLERAWDTLTMLLCLCLVLASTWKRFGGFFKENVIGQALGSMSVPWLLVSMAAAASLGLCLVWALRERVGLFGRIWKIVRGIWEGVVSCLHMESGWMFIVLTVGIWACYWMTAASIIWAVQGIGDGAGTMDPSVVSALGSMGLVDALFLMTVGSVSSLVPVPGGFGAYHYLVSLALLSVYGIPMPVGIVFATLSHESQALMQMVCGLWGYFSETFKKQIL